MPLRFGEEVQKVPRSGLKPTGPGEGGLSKRERTHRAFRGGDLDRRPFTFWHPFGLSHMKADSLVAASLTFAAVYGVDLLRMPLVRDLPLPAQTSLDRPHDLAALESFSARHGFWGERLEALQTIVRKAEQRIAVFETMADPLTSLSWVTSPELLAQSEQSHPNFLDKALATVTEAQRSYLKILLQHTKVDGVAFEISSASFEARPPEDFVRLVKPHLAALLEEAAQHGQPLIWLHLRGRRLYLEPLLDLPHDGLCWPHLDHGPSFDKLPRSYSGALTGGLSSAAISQASFQDLRRQVEEARNFPVRLLCPGDELAADTAPFRLQGLASFLGKRDRAPVEAAPRAPQRVIDEP